MIHKQETLKEIPHIQKKYIDGSNKHNDQKKKENNPITAVATMTLELGIDLGSLERVVQIGTPNSISSFVQRLGRTGRNSGIKEMCFSFMKDKNMVQEEMPWDLLYSIAKQGTSPQGQAPSTARGHKIIYVSEIKNI